MCYQYQQLSDDHQTFITLTAGHRRTKLTAPETISSSRGKVGAHQNLNGSRDLTTPFQGWFAIRGLALALFTCINLPIKFEV